MTLTAFNRRRRERVVTQVAVEPAPPSPSPPPADRPLEKRTKAELLALAGERGLDVPATATKTDVIALLEEPAAESETE